MSLTNGRKAGPLVSSGAVTVSWPCQSCVVHPIVLLSVVDHYNRVAKDTQKRVVGMLLGSVSKGVVDITNCYAVRAQHHPDLNSIPTCPLQGRGPHHQLICDAARGR